NPSKRTRKTPQSRGRCASIARTAAQTLSGAISGPSSRILKVLACCLHASIPTAQGPIVRFGSAGSADNEVNSRIEHGNPRNCLTEESRAQPSSLREELHGRLPILIAVRRSESSQASAEGITDQIGRPMDVDSPHDPGPMGLGGLELDTEERR